MVVNDGVTKLEALGGNHEKSPVTKDNDWKASMAAYEGKTMNNKPSEKSTEED